MAELPVRQIGTVSNELMRCIRYFVMRQNCELARSLARWIAGLSSCRQLKYLRVNWLEGYLVFDRR
jgi:hypothetical protein